MKRFLYLVLSILICGELFGATPVPTPVFSNIQINAGSGAKYLPTPIIRSYTTSPLSTFQILFNNSAVGTRFISIHATSNSEPFVAPTVESVVNITITNYTFNAKSVSFVAQASNATNQIEVLDTGHIWTKPMSRYFMYYNVSATPGQTPISYSYYLGTGSVYRPADVYVTQASPTPSVTRTHTATPTITTSPTVTRTPEVIIYQTSFTSLEGNFLMDSVTGEQNITLTGLETWIPDVASYEVKVTRDDVVLLNSNVVVDKYDTYFIIKVVDRTTGVSLDCSAFPFNMFYTVFRKP